MKRITILLILLNFTIFALPVRSALAEDNAVRYISTGDPWVQQGKLTASDGGFNDQFGVSMSISGDTLVIGARYDDSYKGAAFVFEKPMGGWANMTETAKLTASDGAANDQFGLSVTISGDTVVVGARDDDGHKGAAYVFEKPVGGWADMTETAKLTASDGAGSDVFGHSVAISGDIVVVGAYGDDNNYSNSGSAYVFEKPVSGWTDMTETAKLTASDGVASDQFGYSVAISDDTLVIGADGDNVTYQDQGSAYVFEKPVGGWSDMTETAKLTAGDGAQDDNFGAFVAISLDTVVIGAPGVDITNGATIYDVGRAYVFEKPVGGWADMIETAKLTASDGAANDEFGYSVAISLDTVVIGAWGADGYIGSAYVFDQPVGGWADMTETAKLTAGDGVAYDDFGYSVAISLDTVVAGAHLDDDNGNSSGSAYVFAAIDLCEGDFEPDGDVDGSDLAVFAADFGRTDCDVGPPCEGDFDGDNDVDGTDLAVFAADFGRTDCP